MARKKIKDRAAKNVETFVQKEQTNKCKAALFSDSVAKKKKRKTEDIVETEFKLDSKARVELENSNVVCKFEFIKLWIISSIIELKFYWLFDINHR